MLCKKASGRSTSVFSIKRQLSYGRDFHQTELCIELDAYIPLLRCCRMLSHVKKLHVYMAIHGYDHILYLQNVLLEMYSKCGSLAETCLMFTKMQSRDVFSWNVTISSYARHGHTDIAFDLFQEMWYHDVDPNQFTLVSILSFCNSKSLLAIGEYMHTVSLMGDECENDVVLETSIVNMYSKCGDLKAALVTFNKMIVRNVYSWSAIIAAYAQHGQGGDALKLFDLMLCHSGLPNQVTFISVLDACADSKDILAGTRAHSRLIGTEISCDVVVATSFVNMYAKCGSVREARKVFDAMLERNIISWNAMISAYSQHGEGMDAIELYKKMKENLIEPNSATFVSVLDACSGILALKEGESIHSEILASEFEPDVVLWTALVNMYGKCGCLKKACEVFESMPHKNNVSWNTIIAAHAQRGCCIEAFAFFYQMQWEAVVPDHVTFVSLFDACARLQDLANGKRFHSQIIIKGFEFDVTVGTAIMNMYCKCGIVDEARRLFDILPGKNSITWSSMIGAYAQQEQGNVAFQLYGMMHRESVIPDKISCISILDVCADMSALVEGELVHLEVVMEAYECDDIVGTTIVSLYGRCGSLESARAVFEKMSVRSVVTWNALIAGHAQHGNGEVTLELFNQMQDAGVIPTDVTFISVLNACSHAGLVNEGCHWFNCMCRKYGIKASVDHYGCMVDLLGRAGLLSEAEGLIDNMPEEPTVATWMSLLGACRHQTDLNRAERAFTNLFHLDPINPGPRVMLFNMYALSGTADTATWSVNTGDSSIS